MPPREYVILFAGKLFYITYMLLLPVLVLGKSPLLVGLAFLLVHLVGRAKRVAGVSDHTHCRYDVLPSGPGRCLTTACITSSRRQRIMRPDNPVVGWLAGGLNHHIAHHLCPFVCHTHYAPLTRIVRETAQEFGVPYRQNRTMTQAIRQHLVLLKANLETRTDLQGWMVPESEA